jgi:hypothetical protein
VICSPRKNVTKCDDVGPHAKDAPLLCKGLGKAYNARFGGGIVSLADVAVKSRRAGDVDDAAILGGRARFGLDAHIRRSGADETEGRPDVDLQYDVPCVIRRRVYHAVIGKTSCCDKVKREKEQTPPNAPLLTR